MKTLNERSNRNLAGIHPRLVALLANAIQDCPIPFTVTEGVRTAARQQQLYAQGRTTPGKIVTHTDGINKKSAHQPKPDGYGYAVDLYPEINGKVDVNNIAALTRIAAHIKAVAAAMNISTVWGGDWKMKDYPHFELKA